MVRCACGRRRAQRHDRVARCVAPRGARDRRCDARRASRGFVAPRLLPRRALLHRLRAASGVRLCRPAAAGAALEAKYAAPLFLVPLIVGAALGPSRRVLFTRHAAIGAAVCTALALPSAIWQVAHGLPFIELLHAASHGKNVVVPPLEFAMNQLGVMNPVLAPMWVAGVAWCLVARELARLRFLAIAFAAV